MKKTFAFIITTLLGMAAISQPVTGVWKGRVTRVNGLVKQSFKLELKLIKTGDSLVGTAYYFANANNYYRYSVKGYFDAADNSVNWWDDELIENKSAGIKLGAVNNLPMMTEADFNCPGNGIMTLDGKSHPKSGGYHFDVHLDKNANPSFKDEWDPVIENYFVGGADPSLIDSVSKIAFRKNEPVKEVAMVQNKPTPILLSSPGITQNKSSPSPTKPTTKAAVQVVAKPNVQKPQPTLVQLAPPALTIEQKFTERKKTFTTEIPIITDSIEFRFYDNAEVDGDSISIFLNKVLIQTHIRLSEKAYIITLPTAALSTENELVMVAENLGSIPQNTAYMEAWSGGVRYSARMESTELSSAMIRLRKPFGK